MVRPAQQRAAVAHLQDALGISQRRACRLVGAVRTTVRYRRRGSEDDALRTRLLELRAQRPRFGYRRLEPV